MGREIQSTASDGVKQQHRAVPIKDFAHRWSISQRFAWHLVDEGVIPVVRLGRKCVRVPVPEADEALLKYQVACAIK